MYIIKLLNLHDLCTKTKPVLFIKYYANMSLNTMKQFYLKSILFLSALIISQSACAAGLWLYEAASPELGTASAGSAAIANSASTAGFNPAGMTRLNDTEFMVGIQPMYVDAKFDIDAATYGNDDGGNAGGFVPSASMFYVTSLTDDIKFGLAMGSYLGLGLDYGESWAGRYFITEGELLTLAINPSLGYKVNQQFSIGAGVDFVYSKLNQKIAFNNNPFGIGSTADGMIEIEDSDIAYGFNLGLLYEFSESTRIGLTYRSQVDIEFEDALKLKNVLPIVSGINSSTNTDIEMNLPATVILSGYHKVDKQWSVMANIGWQDWSEFGETDFTLKNLNQKFTDDRNFKDTWHIALGAHYQLSAPWTLMAGIAYDSSPVSDKYRTIDMPLDRQIRYAFGAQYEFSKDLSIMAGYELLDAGQAKINQTRGILDNDILNGDFKTNIIHIMTLNARWKF